MAQELMHPGIVIRKLRHENKARILWPILILVIAFAVSGCGAGQSYPERRKDFTTKLLYHEPAPQYWEEATPPTNVDEIFYESGDLKLKAWVYVPDGDRTTPKPALVYLHGGFAFAPSDLEATASFMDAGYVVMCPMLRGENGNPGDFEMLYGEVDDAAAAINWLVAQPYVDEEQMYAFGHSVGGAISALLALRNDIPIQHSGSASGLYGPDFFEDWSETVPFDRTDQEEMRLRLLLGNIRDMQLHHYAFVGTQEKYFQRQAIMAKREMESSKIQEPLLHLEAVPGDHFSALTPAILEYLKVIQATD